MKKASLGLGFMIQFKAKTPSINLNNKNPMFKHFYYKFALMVKILML